MRKRPFLRLSLVNPCVAAGLAAVSSLLEHLPGFSDLWSHKICSERTLRMSLRYPQGSLRGGHFEYTPETPPTASVIPFAGNCLTGNIREMGRLVRHPWMQDAHEWKRLGALAEYLHVRVVDVDTGQPFSSWPICLCDRAKKRVGPTGDRLAPS